MEVFVRRIIWKLSLVTFLLLLSSSAFSGSLFKIYPRDHSGSNAPGTIIADRIFDELETLVNENLPDADQSDYLEGMANSFTMANKGTGASYGSNFTFGVIGGGLGIGADLGGDSLFDLISGDTDAKNVKGFGAQAGVMIGVNLGLFPWSNLGPIEFDRMKAYLQFISFSPPKTDDVELDISHFSLHLQYKLFEGEDILAGSVKWNGVDVTSGLEISTLKFSISQQITESYSDSGATASFSGLVNVSADVDITSIPIEVSTSARFLYIFTGIFGLAGDFAFGSSASSAGIPPGDANISATDGSNVNSTGTATLDLGSEGSPDAFSMRTFFGLQLNVPVVSIYAMLQKSITQDTWGANLGVRLGW